MCSHTPARPSLLGLLQRLYILRNILISQGGCIVAARRSNNLREEARKSAMRPKTQVSFPLCVSLLRALWHQTEHQLTEPTSLLPRWRSSTRRRRRIRWRMVQGKWDWGCKNFPITSTTWCCLHRAQRKERTKYFRQREKVMPVIQSKMLQNET